MKKTNIFLLAILFVSVFVSCKNDDGSSILLEEVIPPIVSINSNNDNFSYSIVAVKYNKQDVYNLQILADSIRYSIATTAMKSGVMEVIVELKDGTKLVSRQLTGVIAVNDSKRIKSQLSKVTLNYSNFTGQFAFQVNNAF